MSFFPNPCIINVIRHIYFYKVKVMVCCFMYALF